MQVGTARIRRILIESHFRPQTATVSDPEIGDL